MDIYGYLWPQSHKFGVRHASCSISVTARWRLGMPGDLHREGQVIREPRRAFSRPPTWRRLPQRSKNESKSRKSWDKSHLIEENCWEIVWNCYTQGTQCIFSTLNAEFLSVRTFQWRLKSGRLGTPKHQASAAGLCGRPQMISGGKIAGSTLSWENTEHGQTHVNSKLLITPSAYYNHSILVTSFLNVPTLPYSTLPSILQHAPIFVGLT